MLNRIDYSAHGLLRMGIVGVALWAAPSALWCQSVSPRPQAALTSAQPFAGVDDSLSRTADTLLASVNRATPPITSETQSSKTRNNGLAPTYDQRSKLMSNGGQSRAEVRMNLLRPTVDPILRSHGIPVELAAVILVESGGRATALSPKGARGLWQLMPDTARRYGLVVDQSKDDRIDLFKSTDAAARYLHDLYAQFGDWKLALAAYNTGEANVGVAILKAHTQDFDQLTSLRMLPLETRNYVPRVLATAQLIGQSSNLVEGRRPVSGTTNFAVSNP